MAKDKHPGKRQRYTLNPVLSTSGGLSSPVVYVCCTVLLSLLKVVVFGEVKQALAFDSFSSFSFGSTRSGTGADEPHFSFGGFNPGGAGGLGGGGRAVDNEGYYKVWGASVDICLSPLRLVDYAGLMCGCLDSKYTRGSQATRYTLPLTHALLMRKVSWCYHRRRDTLVDVARQQSTITAPT